MHKSSTRWHLLGWLAYAGYEVVGKFLEHSATPLRMKLWLGASLLLVQMVGFYVCYLLVYPRFLRAGRTAALAAALGGVITLFMGLRAFIDEVIYPAVLGFHNYVRGLGSKSSLEGPLAKFFEQDFIHVFVAMVEAKFT
ncbi:hypothetical protein, partial [Hymenobacter algoricola]|uniref:hypothetical protein n=1 Tax=Hymenobacter algoricola TaxID=486267 RepID=UPI0031EE67C1